MLLMSSERELVVRGRGAQSQPANPYLKVRTEPDYEHLDLNEERLHLLGRRATEYFADASQSIVSENNSPDIKFRYTANPYRGCAHGCSYCYARPTHEYLGLSAGLDFETRVMVKHDAALLFRKWLARPRYQPEVVSFSGVTDCYQPAERAFRITRGCLEVAVECRQPIALITKNALVTRDTDLLADLAKHGAAEVAVSITTLDAELARVMEPRTSSPAARLRAIRQLSAAGIPVRLMLAPIIPGLNDAEAPALLEAARAAGATRVGQVLLRLPTTVRPIFLEWLDRFQPTKHDRVVSLIKSTRAGRMNDAQFGKRMRGGGAYAEQIHQTIELVARRLGYDPDPPPLNTEQFRPPILPGGQRHLF